jgi:CDP-paratose 2-epimerase
MKLLITGICGFVGSSLAQYFRATSPDWEIHGLDNFIRPGSERNRLELKRLGVKVRHADLRCASDFETLPAVDAVIDAAANPSVLAGIDGSTSSRQLVEHNLAGTINLLEYCKAHRSSFLLLSTSRVYSIPPLAALPMKVVDEAFVPDPSHPWPTGISAEGLDETFSTTAPVSLYGSTKLASEALALEYGEAFGFPVWINRCGVLAGAGQFGRADQGIFAYWLHSWKQGRTLRYIGFDGQGHQVRDCLHPNDLARLLISQLSCGENRERIVHVSGGAAQALSLRQLSAWCAERWGQQAVASDPKPRSFDLPWVVLDSRKARDLWDWKPEKSMSSILEEIARQAETEPDWLEISAS